MADNVRRARRLSAILAVLTLSLEHRMAHWLTFDAMQHWELPVLTGFQYDDVPDAHILEALADRPRLMRVDPARDWEDDGWLAACTSIPNERKHAYRIARLVHEFQHGQVMHHGIALDTFNAQRCRSAVGNGHHRVRALQFLGLSAGPFWLGGHLHLLHALLELAGTSPPRVAARFCATNLLVLQEDEHLPPPKARMA